MKLLYSISFLLAFLSACSVATTIHFSEPEHHVKPPPKSEVNISRPVNPRLQKFEARESDLRNVFEDTISNTTVSLWLENTYTSSRVGIPVIPVVPFSSGYGHPENKKAVSEEEKDDKVVVELMFYVKGTDVVNFVPDRFYIKKRAGDKTQSWPFKITGTGLGDTLSNHAEYRLVSGMGSERITIYFSPGVHVEDLPIIYLTSLQVNGKDFYPDGIPFKSGKKRFYSAFVSPE